MQKTKLVNLQHFIEDNGYLTVVQEKSGMMPFPMVRIFNVCANKDDKRGEHAHKKCSQLLFCPYGKIEVNCFTGDKKESFLLDKPSVGLIIYPMVWAEQYYLKNNTILTVICDQKFDENDYIRNYQKYLSLI